MIYWLPEGLAWPGKRTAWLVIVNPLPREQTVQIAIIGQPSLTHRLPVPARARVPLELSGIGARDAFAVEVRCDPVCVASLVNWDAAYAQAHVSPVATGCEVTR